MEDTNEYFITYDSDTVLFVSSLCLGEYKESYLYKLHNYKNNGNFKVQTKNGAILLIDCQFEILKCIIHLMNNSFNDDIIKSIIKDNRICITSLNLILKKYGFDFICSDSTELKPQNIVASDDLDKLKPHGVVVCTFDDIDKKIFIPNRKLKKLIKLAELINGLKLYHNGAKIIDFMTHRSFSFLLANTHKIKKREEGWGHILYSFDYLEDNAIKLEFNSYASYFCE
jgi:hypothetical protein